MSALRRWLGGEAAPALTRAEPYLRPVKAEITPEAPLPEVIRQSLSVAQSSAGVAVTAVSAERLAAVASCVRVLSNDVAHLPLKIYREVADGREKLRDHPLYPLLKKRPNDWQSAFEFRQMLMRDLLLRGNGYAMKVRGRGNQVIALWRLHPDRVQPKQDETTMDVTYRISHPTRSPREVPRTEIVHLRGPSDDGIVGMNPIQQHRETFGLGIALKQHGAAYFAQGAKPGLILTSADMIDEEQAEHLLKRVDDVVSGPGSSFKTMFLPLGIDFKTVNLSMADAQYLEANKFNRSEIAGIFGVPSYKINDLEKATFSNIEHQGIDYVIGSLTPYLVLIEQACDRDLLEEEPDAYYFHTVDALLRGTAKERAEAQRLGRLNGVYSANEIRAQENLNKRPGGDTYIVESNTRPDDGSDPAAAADPAPPPAPDAEEEPKP